LLAVLGAAILALLGAGTGTLFGGGGDDDDGFDLSVDHSVTPDEPNATPTPTPTPAPGGSGSPDDATEPPEQPGTTADTDDGSESDEDPRRFDGEDDEARSAATDPSGDPVTSSIPPVSVSDVQPGDGGVVDLSLTLSGSPARLWVRGDATDFEERGVVDAERSAGDADGPGELQRHLRVRLWYDADRDGAVDDGDTLVYEGTLAGLDGEDGWVPLTADCVSPGTYTARFRWELPSDAPNTVQTDAASFSLGVAADASACE
ncbi:MAG: hypothetical protein V5A16_06450, partial [Haloplanus sp.]